MKKKTIERHRKSETPMHYRTLSVRRDAPDGTPATYDEKTRSVEVIGATEEPVEVFDWERWEPVREILLMDGLEMPAARQVPLLDSHARYSTASVLGSYRDMQAGQGQLTGRVFFSSTPEADGPHTKLREGHITDFSAGYRVVESTWLDDGQTAVIKGRSFAGPVRVTTRWRIKELSICPIGADELAKVRAEHNQPPPAAGGHKETHEMNERLKKWLISRGLPENATDDEAWAYMEKLEIKRAAEIPPPAPKTDAPDLDAERNAATVSERARIAEIDGCARAFNCPDELRERLVKDGTDTAKALRAIMDHAIASRQAGPAHRPSIEHGADERDKFRDAALDSLLLRAPGDLKIKPEKPAPGALDLRGYSLREIARHCLVLGGQPTGGNVLEMVGRALTTSDLPRILAAGANKALLAGWESAEESWRIWCGTGSVPDFKAQNLVRASEFSNLDEIPEHGEYKYGDLSDSKEQVQVATFGKLFAITRQAIINDDLGALVSTPAKMGESAARKVGDLPYAVLTANANMGDGVALFLDATHGNIMTSAVIGIASIAEGIKKMKLQKDSKGLRLLNIRPRYVLAPATVEGAAEVFFRSEKFSDANTVATDSSFASQRVNPYAGSYFTRVYEARLDAASVSNWYLAAEKGMTVNVYFLNGIEAPYMEQKQGWSVDGVEYKVRIDAAAKAVDWRGLSKNAV